MMRSENNYVIICVITKRSCVRYIDVFLLCNIIINKYSIIYNIVLLIIQSYIKVILGKITNGYQL